MNTLFKIITCIILAITNIAHPKFNHIISKSSRKAYPFPGKSVKNMNEEELQTMISYAKEINDSELVFKCFYHIINLSQDHAKIKVYKLDLADYCYSLQDYEKAAGRYEEFCILYPGSQQAEYAQYKLILCTFYISLEPDRDQTNTIKTINLISLFFKRATDKQLINELESIYKTCRKRLLEHEVVVLETYLQQKKFIAAQQRLNYIQENFTDIDNIDVFISYLQTMFDLVQNPQTRPFIFKLNLEKAFNANNKKESQNKNVSKAVSFFVA